jgi:hypothetical protein
MTAPSPPLRRKARRKQEPNKQYKKSEYDGSDPEGQPLEAIAE